jgi:hypothetical protein
MSHPGRGDARPACVFQQQMSAKPSRRRPRLWVLGFALALSLAGAAPASATILVTPDGQIGPQPYQSWVDAALVPTPPGEVVLSLAGCPGDPPLPACSPTNQGTIQLSPGWANRHVLLHELGHIFDDLMPDWARGRFRGMVVRRTMVWTASNSGGPPNEQFAEAYALCASRLSLRVQAFEGYHYAPSPRMHQKVCGLINTAGQAFGE